MSVVSNASPIIILSKIGLFPLLKDLFGSLAITEEVYEEVVSGKGLPGSAELQEARDLWVHIHTTQPLQSLKKHRRPPRLSPADLSVVALAQQENADLVLIDDEHLRQFAKTLSLRVAGTGEILVRAKQAGLIPSVRELLEQAIAHGARFSEELQNQLLSKAGESKPE